ncbi:MAG: hypothetical protein KDH19_14615, partial [Geminicoccaceae bacterium]|nr:hypothetical protein [Geminicoccaceae bacterium]
PRAGGEHLFPSWPDRADGFRGISCRSGSVRPSISLFLALHCMSASSVAGFARIPLKDFRRHDPA